MSDGHVRASDSDRDQVAEVLHTAYAEGRISLDEHEERVSAALAARTGTSIEHLELLVVDDQGRILRRPDAH